MSKFVLPKAGGAWWTFGLCTAAGVVLAVSRRADPGVLTGLVVGMTCSFLASEWLFQWMADLLRNWGSNWHPTISVLGVALVGAALLSLALAWARLDHLQPQLSRELGLVLVAWAAFALFVLALRLRSAPFDAFLLFVSALLMTGPALLLGALALGPHPWKVLEFWGLWAWYFPTAALDLAVWMRRSWLPRWKVYGTDLLLIIPGVLALALGWWPAVLALAPLAARSAYRMAKDLLRRGPDTERSTEPQVLHWRGYEELAFGLLLSAVWVWIFLPQP